VIFLLNCLVSTMQGVAPLLSKEVEKERHYFYALMINKYFCSSLIFFSNCNRFLASACISVYVFKSILVREVIETSCN
jgi:hypothetical protein